MRIELSGATVCVLGRVEGWTKPSIKQAVYDAGCDLVGTPRDGALVLLGIDPDHGQLTEARAHTCTIVERDDALTLLKKGAVEVEDAPPRPLDELTNEARAVLTRGANTDAFDALVALLDACAPEHEDELARGIAPPLAQWPARYSATPRERLADPQLLTGPCGDAGGSVRTMPVHWIAELLRDGPSPKHSICDTLSFSGVEVSSTTAARVFSHGPIGFLRAFSFGETDAERMKKKGFFTKMVKSEALTHVETLAVHRCDEAGLEVLRAHPGCLPSLHTLLLLDSTADLDKATFSYKGAELAEAWAGQLRTLGVSHHAQVRWLRAHRDLFPDLEHVILIADRDERHKMTCTHLPGALEGVRKLTIGTADPSGLEAFLNTLGKHPPDALRVLDLSPNVAPGLTKMRGARRIADAILDARLPEVLDQVVLNSAYSAALKRALIKGGVTVDSVEVEPAPVTTSLP